MSSCRVCRRIRRPCHYTFSFTTEYRLTRSPTLFVTFFQCACPKIRHQHAILMPYWRHPGKFPRHFCQLATFTGNESRHFADVLYLYINVACCVGSVQIQIKIRKCQCTACRYADMDSEVDEFRAYALRQKINRKNK